MNTIGKETAQRLEASPAADKRRGEERAGRGWSSSKGDVAVVRLLNHMDSFATPWTVAHQVLLLEYKKVTENNF